MLIEAVVCMFQRVNTSVCLGAILMHALIFVEVSTSVANSAKKSPPTWSGGVASSTRIHVVT